MVEHEKERGFIDMASNLFEKIKEIIQPKTAELTVMELEDAGLNVYYK